MILPDVNMHKTLLEMLRKLSERKTPGEYTWLFYWHGTFGQPGVLISLTYFLASWSIGMVGYLFII